MKAASRNFGAGRHRIARQIPGGSSSMGPRVASGASPYWPVSLSSDTPPLFFCTSVHGSPHLRGGFTHNTTASSHSRIWLLDISPCDPLRFSSQGRARPTPVIRKALFSTSTSLDEKSERRLELEKLEGQPRDGPLAWNALILGYSELGDAGKAEELLFQMESKAGISSPKVFQSDKPDGMDSLKIDPNALPDIDSYTAVMDAWIEQQTTRPELTRLGIFHAAERAHAILTHMEQIYGLLSTTEAHKAFSTSIRPTSHHYDTVIQAWSKSCVGGGFAARGAPQRAQHLLERMEVYGLDSKSGIKPTVETYNHVISAWGESDEHLRGSRAHAVYEKIADGASVLDIKPNHKTHRVMIRSWSRSEQKPAAFKATGHIMKMQEQLEAGVEDMEPKLEDYHMLLEIWTRAPKTHASRRALGILEYMDNLYMERTSDVRPDSLCYKLVLHTMSRSAQVDRTLEVDGILTKMKDRQMVIDSECFDFAIKTWLNSAKHPEAIDVHGSARRADELLREMGDMFYRTATVVVKPTLISYNDVILAWSKSNENGAAQRAEELLDEMEKLYKEGDENMRPNYETYTWIIEAWSRNRTPMKLKRAKDMLQRMMKDYETGGNESAKPTNDTFHAVAQTCATFSAGSDADKSNALRLAIQTVHDLKKFDGCDANSSTYRILLEACSNLLPVGKEKSKAIETIFKNCCAEGLVDKRVLEQFQLGAPFELYRKTILLGAAGVDSDGKTLPDEWSRNLPFTVRTAEGRRPPPLSIEGNFIFTTAIKNYQMRKLRTRKNQKLLQGGRLKDEHM